MTDTLYADVSEFQNIVTDAYPYGVLEFRSNDGTYLDHHFTSNIGWARAAYKSGKLWAYIVYYFYRPGVNGAQVLINRVGGTAGKSDPHLIAMIDVEGDSGKVTGNQSGQINAEFHLLAHWLGDSKRVIGYGNVGDLNALWPQKPPGIRLSVANYSANPPYPGKFSHQFSNAHVTPPFGPCDFNSADGMNKAELLTMWGLSAPVTPPAKPPVPTPTIVLGTKGAPTHQGNAWKWISDGTTSLAAFAARRNASILKLLQLSAENLGAADFQALNVYVASGVKLPMPVNLAFCTANP